MQGRSLRSSLSPLTCSSTVSRPSSFRQSCSWPAQLMPPGENCRGAAANVATDVNHQNEAARSCRVAPPFAGWVRNRTRPFRTLSDGRPDVLVYAEEVLGVVAILDLHQSSIVVAIAGHDAVIPLVHHHVQIAAAGREGVNGVPVVTYPGDVAVIVGRVCIGGEDDL